MGKKIIGLYATLCVTSLVLISVSCFNKWHQVTFMTLGFKRLFRLETTLTSVTIPGNSKIFCGIFTSHQPKRCGAIQEGTPLQEAASSWCAPLVASFFPAPCVAFNRAYVLGLGVLMMYAFNVIFLGASGYLLFHYLQSKSHKPIYRTWAMILHGIATFLMIGAVASYSVFAVSALDAIGGGGVVGLMEASQSVGISPGYFLVWLGILLQLVAFGMHCCMRLSNEENEDDRIYKEMLKEQQKYGAMEEQTASFQSGTYQAGGAGYGYDASASGYAAAGDSYHLAYGQQPAAYPVGGPPQPAMQMQPQPAGMPQQPPMAGSEGAQPGMAAW